MTSFRDITRDAVQFWEWRRIIYNAVLAGIVIVGFALAWPSSTSWFSQPAFPAILKAAVLANVAYCAAYVVELLFHLSPLP